MPLYESFDKSLLGKNIIISLYNFPTETVVVAVSKTLSKILIGLSKEAYYALPSYREKVFRKRTTQVADLLYVKDYGHYEYTCIVYTPRELEIVNPILTAGQICIGCQLEAPHQKPNKDDKFLCVSCKVIEEFGD
jgi:hypothetical protein